MKEYTTESIRNVALASHSGAGKTLLTEAILHFTGSTTRMGKVEDGTTLSDFEEEEHRRQISLSTSVIPVEYKGVKINLLDTPGYTDFVGEVISALRVADSAILMVDSVAGMEVGTEIAWNNCNAFKLPRVVVINKMERENANFQKALSSIQEFSETRLLPTHIPMGEKADFKGVIDLIGMKAYVGDGKVASEIPAEYLEVAQEARVNLVEAAAEGEDALLEKYLEGNELTTEEVARGLKAAIQGGIFVPVLAISAQLEIGISSLLYVILNVLPSPADVPPAQAIGKDGPVEIKAVDSGPLVAYVWKTTADPYVGKMTFFRIYSGMITSDSRVWNQNRGLEERFGTVSVPRGKELTPQKIFHAGDIAIVPKLGETSTGNTLGDKTHPLTLVEPEYPNALYRVAIHPKTQADSTKISPTLTRLCEEDKTLSWHNEHATGQTILQGMGDQHIEVAIRRAEAKFQVGLTIEAPKVPYTETITKKGQAMYRHKKQTGGSGQFGEVHLRVEPLPEGEFEFVNDVFGGAISNSYMSPIEKGIRSTMKEGIIAGFPVIGVRVSVYDGKEHAVDSKPIAFEIAGREAFKLAFKEGAPVLNEPIMMVKVTVPEEHMGDILGDMNTRRARVLGMETDRGRSIVSATVPLSEMLRYTTHLRSMTGGRGIYTMEFDHYEVVPAHITGDIVAARQKEVANRKEE